MNDFKGFYKPGDIKPGDWVIVGQGHMHVGWNSAVDRDVNRESAGE